jgi:hypothetical protein
MATLRFVVHAREQVERFVSASDLDRLAQRACDAAERSPDWQPGKEFLFLIDEEPYTIEGLAPSVLTVSHRGTDYEVFYFDGPMADTITDDPSCGKWPGCPDEPGAPPDGGGM